MDFGAGKKITLFRPGDYESRATELMKVCPL